MPFMLFAIWHSYEHALFYHSTSPVAFATSETLSYRFSLSFSITGRISGEDLSTLWSVQFLYESNNCLLICWKVLIFQDLSYCCSFWKIINSFLLTLTRDLTLFSNCS